MSQRRSSARSGIAASHRDSRPGGSSPTSTFERSPIGPLPGPQWAPVQVSSFSDSRWMIGWSHSSASRSIRPFRFAGRAFRGPGSEGRGRCRLVSEPTQRVPNRPGRGRQGIPARRTTTRICRDPPGRGRGKAGETVGRLLAREIVKRRGPGAQASAPASAASGSSAGSSA